jgi:hypothetical protein
VRVPGGDEILRGETHEIQRFVALGLGPYDAIRAVEAGVDPQAVAVLVSEQALSVAAAVQLAR